MKAEFNNSIADLKTLITLLGLQISKAETRISSTEDKLEWMDTEVTKLRKDNEYLMNKVEYLKNYNRRNNSHIIGLPQGWEGTDSIKFCTLLFLSIFSQENFSDPVIVERAHRSLVPHPPPESSPRPLLVQFLKYQDRERVLCYAAKM